MYIQPNTEIRLLTNVPLDNTYEHTIWFKNYRDSNKAYKSTAIALAFQHDYFVQKTKHLIQKNTYQRVNDGVMRVGMSADACYDCNYLMFKNTNHGNKWFYAFITSVRYINELTCEITYEIDVMQTYMYDYVLGESFIEREHTADDTIGKNTYPEDLEQGEYMVINSGTVDDPSYENFILDKNVSRNRLRIVFQTSFTYQDGNIYSRVVPYWGNGVLTGLSYVSWVVDLTDEEDKINVISYIASFLTKVEMENKWDGIINCFVVPADWDWSIESGSGPSGIYGIEQMDYVTAPYTYIGNRYYPKNKKLFCYPYNVMHIYTDTGCIDLRYEFFTRLLDEPEPHRCYFAGYTTIAPTPAMILLPRYYMGLGDNPYDATESFEYSLTLKDYPQCAVSGDTYKIWYAQNGVVSNLQIATNVLEGVTPIVGGAVSGATGLVTQGASLGATPVKGAIGSVAGQGAVQSTMSNASTLIGNLSSVLQQLARRDEIKSRAGTVTGNQSSLSNYAFGLKHFFCSKLSIRNEYAKKIDDFFSKFGYKTMELKTPNIDRRKYWWYTKTLGCEIHEARMPNDDLSLIASIYDKGITFWKWSETEGVDIANYSKDNVII